MLSYNPSASNRLQVESERRSLLTRQALVDWIKPSFAPTDCFVTLTYPDYVKYQEVERSADVTQFLKRLNRKVFGKGAEIGKKRLKSCPIFEFNVSDGLHLHMLLEKPTDAPRLEQTFEHTVIDTWTKMKRGGVAMAQDVRSCLNTVDRLIYQTKQIKSGDTLTRVDFLNLHLTTVEV